MESADVGGTGGDVGRLCLQPQHQLFKLAVERVASVELAEHENGAKMPCDNRIADPGWPDFLVLDGRTIKLMGVTR